MRGRCFLVVLFLFLVFSVEAFGQVVEIPDPNLRSAIEEALNKRAGARITADEMAELWSIHGSWRDIRDLTGLEYAINLRGLHLNGNKMLDISPIAGLINLGVLDLRDCKVPDIAPVSGLLNLEYLDLSFNRVISDLSPLAGLLRLEWLEFRSNLIQDVSPLSGLINLRHIAMDGNFVSDVSPLLSNTGLSDGDTIYLAGNPLSSDSLNKDIPALRRKGVYVNMAAFVSDISPDAPLRVGNEFTYHFKIKDGVDLSGWQVDLSYNREVLELLTITWGDFLASGNTETMPPKGYSADVGVLQEEIKDNKNWVRYLYQVRLDGGASGDGTLFSCRFRIKEMGWTGIWLLDSFLTTSDRTRVRAAYSFDDYWIDDPPTADVNGDGKIDIDDLLLIAEHIGERGEGLLFDVDNNWVVDIRDMIFVIQRFGTTPASPAAVSDMTLPAGLTSAMVREWIDMAHTADDGSVAFRKGIATLNELLEAIGPDETALLPNYPNPFNPETWIPYHLAADTDVQLTIYDTTGAVVRRFDVGHRVAGYYTDRARAVYWDGRNDVGESVGSGVYFYHLSAGDYSQTRRMVILK